MRERTEGLRDGGRDGVTRRRGDKLTEWTDRRMDGLTDGEKEGMTDGLKD